MMQIGSRPTPGATRPSPSPRDPRWADLRLRIVSAAILGPFALVCIWCGGVPFALLMLVGAVGATFEWLQMAQVGRASRATAIAGLAYILLAAASLVWLRVDPLVGRINFLFLLLLVWASDIGAYVVGRGLGGPRLAPRISPGKTVSGALGGLAAAALVGIVAAVLSAAPLSIAGLTAGLLGMVAQAGDLAESYAKRHFGVKDSGRLIPGHGGLLDRLDALLAAALAAAVLALVLGRGVVLWR